MKKFFHRAIVAAAATAAVSAAVISASAYADWKQIGFMGDLNGDSEINIADAVLLTRHLLGEEALTTQSGYDVSGEIIGINGGDGFKADGILDTADINQDGKVNIYDLVLMRKHIVYGSGYAVWKWEESAVTTTSSVTVTPAATTTAAPKFIDPPIYDLYGSMPSQGDGSLLVFYVDFPDCKYSYLPSVSEIDEIVFGKANNMDMNYPFESLNAFYERSSKGAMKLTGKTYTYTAKKNKAYYEDDLWHVDLVEEIIAEFDSKIDFSQFDGDKDKVVDSILISVPTAAGDDYWWPAAGVFGGDVENKADGMDLGHVIVGNAEIASVYDHSNFVSSYVHELGHCMGLPDFYLYGVDDYQGMHGSAGFEMMDDANCDFGAASKLMLGWYQKEQINIFDKKYGSQTFTLKNGQSGEGNCLIIPCGDLGYKFRSEFFILEYATLDGNNKKIESEWWRRSGSGVRVYHVEATESGDIWYNSWKYASGEDEATNYGNGRRFIRLVGEGTDDTDNLYRTGAVIDSSVPEFNMYDSSGKMTIDPGVVITVGEKTDEGYKVTVSVK